MFSTENLSALYSIIGVIPFPLYFISLIICWKNTNCRYLFLILIFVETVDTLTLKMAFNWGRYFYLWGIGMCLLFIVPILGRRLLAQSLQTRFSFFQSVLKDYHFSKQEGGLLFLYVLTGFVFFLTFVEFVLFEGAIIGDYFFKKYLFSPILIMIFFVECFLVMSIASRFRGHSLTISETS
ncbi:hypothetical protein A7985_01955 [Pseudoalteromonas luteoviolacea]|uniref:Uncharacterized protein n=1 Tax=Pseudoalteromonas luteoviolacea TaxID=43657 RepID=A0A1C0TTU2_9GAMM|nr:hypothetical protein [Pseudoalteromonas luteoviolacea]OCQ22745.1 hypothetical protein A7985_01955 [Pseudoalteromonas luteoviolacea]